VRRHLDPRQQLQLLGHLLAHRLSSSPPAPTSHVFATYTPGIPSSSTSATPTSPRPLTPVQAFSVGSANTTTGLGLSLTSVAYGAETSEIFTVSVTGQSGDGYPEGTVAVYNSSTKLCGATLTPVSGYSSSATCSLTAYQLTAGAYRRRVRHLHPRHPVVQPQLHLRHLDLLPRSRPSRCLGESTATTTTSLELSAAQVTYGDEQVEQLSVSVSPQYAGTTPTGTVTISGANCQITLSSGKGSCTLPACLLQRRQPPNGRHLQRQFGLQAVGFGEKDRHHRHGHDDDKPQAVCGTSHLPR
jgi:hypothetical protein